MIRAPTKNQNFTSLENFFSNAIQELETRKEIVIYEMLHIEGEINIFDPIYSEAVRRIDLINDINFGLRPFYAKNQNFIASLRAFNDADFVRKGGTPTSHPSKDLFLLNNEAIFMHCVTAFFTQIASISIYGNSKYLKSESSKLFMDAAKILNTRYKSNHFKKHLSSLPVNSDDLSKATEFIEHLNIKKTGPGASRKVAAVVFTMFFGNFFIIDQKNQKFITKILFELFPIAYKDRTPDEAKIRSYVKNTIERAKSC